MHYLRRGLSRACGLNGPPVATVVLMLLLCCLSKMGGCELLGLEPGLILWHFQVHRVFTYPLCPPDSAHLILDLLLFVLLGWRQERGLGTLRYLHCATLCAMASAVLYFILAPLFSQSLGGACGFTTIHFALMAAQPLTRCKGVLGRVAALALPWGMLLCTSLLFSRSPFLLYTCGALTGLVYSAGALSWLEVSEQKLEQMEARAVCRTLARNPFVHFVPIPRREWTLPHTDPLARDRLPEPLETYPPRESLPDGYFQSSSERHGALRGGHIPPGSWMQQPFFQGGEHPQAYVHAFSPWDPTRWLPDTPLTFLENSMVDEEMLQAGIQASLEQSELGAATELTLSKSSVSALRLQQLERMGFPNPQAVVALAATGKVEGAVSLLVEGQVGEEAVVTTGSGLHHPLGYRDPQRSGRLQEATHLSGQ